MIHCKIWVIDCLIQLQQILKNIILWRTWRSQKFYNIFVHVYDKYIMVGSIMLVGVLDMLCIVSFSDLKATQTNKQGSLIWEFMFCKFELGHNAVKATKNICSHNINQMVQEIMLGLQDPQWSDKVR